MLCGQDLILSTAALSHPPFAFRSLTRFLQEPFRRKQYRQREWLFIAPPLNVTGFTEKFIPLEGSGQM